MTVTVRNRSGQVVTVSSPEHCEVIERLIEQGEVEQVEAEKPKAAPRKRTARKADGDT